MAAYVIIDVDVTDAEAYGAYGRAAGPTVEQYGGKLLARGGMSEALEGSWEPGRIVVIEFQSGEQARRWYNSAEYGTAKQQRQGATKLFNAVLVEGS